MSNGVPDVPIAGEVIRSFFSNPFGAIGDFFGFGGGGKSAGELEHDRKVREAQINRERNIAELQRLASLGNTSAIQQLLEFYGPNALPVGVSPITGRPPIPPPEMGGPELVTERFQTLVPFLPPVTEEPVATGMEEATMALDVPLLTRGIQIPSLFGTIDIPPIFGQPAPSPTFPQPIPAGMGQISAAGIIPPTSISTAIPQIPVLARGVARVIPRILAAIRARLGVRISLSRAKAIIRTLGLASGAAALGITAHEAASLLAAPTPRRRRGISAADIRCVKRTARRFSRLQDDLSDICRVSRPRAAPRRRRVQHVRTAAIAHQ